MKVTEIRIKLLPQRQQSEDRLRAFCTVTFDNSFVIRDLKVIEGQNGFFVAMPSRKLTARCPRCSGKNHLRARYCNDCGCHLRPKRVTEDNRLRFHADIAHRDKKPVLSLDHLEIADNERVVERNRAERAETVLTLRPGFFDDRFRCGLLCRVGPSG